MQSDDEEAEEKEERIREIGGSVKGNMKRRKVKRWKWKGMKMLTLWSKFVY